MTKRILAMTLCLALTLLACACAASNATVSAPENTDSKGEGTTDLSTMEQLGTSLPVAQMSSQPAFSDAVSKPTEPILPEERETTLELVRKIPLGDGGLPYYLQYDSSPTYAQIFVPYDYTIDANGRLYCYMENQICDVETQKVIRVKDSNDTSDAFLSTFFASEGKLYVAYTDGKLSTFDMEKGLLSTVKLPDNRTGIVNVFPTDQGTPLVKIDSTVYHADNSRVSLPFSFTTDTKNGNTTLTFEKATYSAKDSFAILSHVDGILTVKESQDRWYTRRDEGRHIVYETLFCQYDESGNPVSRFKVVATSCPIKRPCQVGGCEWASLRTLTIGETVFENVYMANFFSGADGELYAILVYTDGAKLYRINPGYSDVEFTDLDSMEDPYHTCKNCGGAES